MSQDRIQSGPAATRLKGIVQYALLLFCVAYIIRFFWNNQESLNTLLSLDLWALGMLAVLSVISLFLQSFRQRIILHKINAMHIPYMHWFRIFILGTFLNRVFSQFGNIYRGIRLKKEYGISYTHYISIYVSFSWLDTTLNFLIALAVVGLLDRSLQIGSVRAVWLLLLLAIAVAVVPLLLHGLASFLRTRIPYFSWLQTRLGEVLRVTVAGASDPLYLAKVALTGLLSFALTLSVFYVSFKALGMEVPWPVLALFCVIMKLSNQIVLTPGNLGVRELAYGILGELAGVGMAQALLVSLITRIMNTSVIIFMGIAFGGLGLLFHRDQYQKSAF
ncbi:MAG: flippase-like domain-containing protein [Sedimentisphaerales bacterium]|nr:flippase-like domain-containing protein [Sedimentisphaerales bacterium]